MKQEKCYLQTSQNKNSVVANFAETPRALLLRFNPSAEVKAFRNPDYTFDKTTPMLKDVFEQMGEEAVLGLINTHLINYTSMNSIKLPDGDPKSVITSIAQSMYEDMKFWSIGEMLYFFFMLNKGELGDNENYCSISNIHKKIKKFNQFRLEEETKVRNKKETERENQINEIKRQCWEKVVSMNLSKNETYEMFAKIVNEKIHSLNK